MLAPSAAGSKCVSFSCEVGGVIAVLGGCTLLAVNVETEPI